MKSIKTEIIINATPEMVWQVLMDFEKYPQWNPFVTSITGDKESGGKLKVVIHPPDSTKMVFKPDILELQLNREFRWKGKLIIPGLFDGEHIFILEPMGNEATKFRQEENFSGILVNAMWNKIEGNTRKGFEAMNAALKARAEKI